MSLEPTTCEDLKAFERRLTEVVGYLQPAAIRWRSIVFKDTFKILLLSMSVCTAIGAYFWLTDPQIKKLTFCQSLMGHLFFVISAVLLILFLCGIHKKVVLPSIIIARIRLVLNDFNMSCDDSGKLILKPRPNFGN